MSKKKKAVRCEGWRRTGIFQMGGTGCWEQCKNDAEFNVTVTQERKTKTFPACKVCLKETNAAENEAIKVKKVILL
jgi:hypothetical protein